MPGMNAALARTATPAPVLIANRRFGCRMCHPSRQKPYLTCPTKESSDAGTWCEVRAPSTILGNGFCGLLLFVSPAANARQPSTTRTWEDAQNISFPPATRCASVLPFLPRVLPPHPFINRANTPHFLLRSVISRSTSSSVLLISTNVSTRHASSLTHSSKLKQLRPSALPREEEKGNALVVDPEQFIVRPLVPSHRLSKRLGIRKRVLALVHRLGRQPSIEDLDRSRVGSLEQRQTLFKLALEG